MKKAIRELLDRKNKLVPSMFEDKRLSPRNRHDIYMNAIRELRDYHAREKQEIQWLIEQLEKLAADSLNKRT